ncbi:MAG: hypothetical protein L0Z53_26875 [Acidobacteriales bacterium]|nr:hypothetical protein [Terriglobales bacterium]
MKRLLLGAAATLAILSACASSETGESKAREVAQQQMTADNFADAAITDVVEGDAASQGADELYCVATDATTQNGELPYLLLVWREGSEWQVLPMAEGYYEWDLYGCPR